MPILPLEPLFRLFANLSSRGGEPRQEGAALLYPLRPGFRLFFLCAFLFGLNTLATLPSRRPEQHSRHPDRSRAVSSHGGAERPL